MELTKQANHEIAIQHLERQLNIFVWMPGCSFPLMARILGVTLHFFAVFLDVRQDDDAPVILRDDGSFLPDGLTWLA